MWLRKRQYIVLLHLMWLSVHKLTNALHISWFQNTCFWGSFDQLWHEHTGKINDYSFENARWTFTEFVVMCWLEKTGLQGRSMVATFFPLQLLRCYRKCNIAWFNGCLSSQICWKKLHQNVPMYCLNKLFFKSKKYCFCRVKLRKPWGVKIYIDIHRWLCFLNTVK